MTRNAGLIVTALAAVALALAACGQVSETGKTDTPAQTMTGEEEPVLALSETTQYCDEVGRRLSVEDCADLGQLAAEAAVGTAAFNAPDPMQRNDVHTLQLAISPLTPEELTQQQRLQNESRSAEQAAAAQQEEQERQEQFARDDAAFTAARSANDQSAYENYLSQYPNGLHAGEARESLTQLGVTAPPPAPLPSDVVDPLQGETVEFTPMVGRFMRAELVGNGFEITPLTAASQEVLPNSVTTWSWRVVANEGGRRSLTLRTVVEGCTASQCYPLRSTSHNYEVNVTVGFVGQAQDLLTAAPIWLRLLAGVLTALAVLVGAWFGLRNAFHKGRVQG